MLISRRHILGGLIAAPVVVRSAVAQSGDVEIAIIGAGAAGIGAGRWLSERGRSIRIFEAGGRPGGRVFTDSSLGQPFDAGAAYIHWNDTNPWREIAREVGVPTIPEPDGGGFQVFAQGKPVPQSERGARRGAFGRLSSLLDDHDSKSKDVSFADIAAKGPPELMMAARGLTMLSLGEDPQRVSVRDYAELWAGDDLMAPSGYGTLVATAAVGLPIVYGTVVKEIRRDGDGVSIITDAGTTRASKVIITVSVGVLQAEAIRFTPALPVETLRAIEGIGMGALTKVALKFDGDRLGLEVNTDLFDIDASGNSLNAEAWAFDRDIMLCMFGGDYARGLAQAGAAAAVDAILTRVVEMLGGDARRHFVAGRLAGWSADPLTLGSYSIAKVGRYDARAALARPVDDKLWFAGEATAGGGAMTAGGATLAGRRAAAEATRTIKG